MSENKEFSHIYFAHKCPGCGKQPNLIKWLSSMLGRSPEYEMGCRDCGIYSGPFLTPEEAKANWDSINSEEEV